jgi:hypothetical protein
MGNHRLHTARRFTRKRICVAFLSLTCSLRCVTAGEVRKFSFPLPTDMRRADVYAVETATTPRALLVLCPGCNGNGHDLICQAAWRRFAAENNIGLLGLSFASDESLLPDERGYYYASKGSGAILLRAVDQIYGHKIPLLLYGFSGGAHFTSRFVEWKPAEVLGWCAYSAGWWDNPLPSQKTPPGVLACGEDDGARYGATLSYFLQGRAYGKPWTWVSLAKTGHVASRDLDEFVREYFAALLACGLPGKEPLPLDACWYDNDSRERTTPQQVNQHPTLTSWLPSESVARKWRALHQP